MSVLCMFKTICSALSLCESISFTLRRRVHQYLCLSINSCVSGYLSLCCIRATLSLCLSLSHCFCFSMVSLHICEPLHVNHLSLSLYLFLFLYLRIIVHVCLAQLEAVGLRQCISFLSLFNFVFVYFLLSMLLLVY